MFEMNDDTIVFAVFEKDDDAQTAVFRLPDDPGTMGILIADAIKTMAKGYKDDRESTLTEDFYIDRIRELLDKELNNPTQDVDMTTIQPPTKQ